MGRPAMYPPPPTGHVVAFRKDVCQCVDVSASSMARSNKKFESRAAKDYSSYSTAGMND